MDGKISPTQQGFLKYCRRSPRPLAVLLKERGIGADTFARWRGEEAFERAFRRASRGLTRDTLADLRFTFALCGHIVSSEMAGIYDAMQKGGEEGVENAEGDDAKKEAKKEKKIRPKLDPGVYRMCLEMIRVGMGAFVEKRGTGKRRAFPRVDPELFARLRKAQGEG